MTIRLVADDLTGALDAVVQFTGLEAPIPVWPDRLDCAGAGSAAVNLASRDATETDAVAASRASAAFLAAGDIRFKKFDSLLRGHWAAELAALRAETGFRRCIVAPAYPAQGRLTRGGRQFVRRDGAETVLDIDIPDLLARCGLRVARNGGAGEVVLCDAESDADLAAVVARERRRDGVLWVGSAGLAAALAGRPSRCCAPAAGPVLAVVGSRHPVARAQVAAAAQALPEAVLEVGADTAAAARVLADRASEDDWLVTFALPGGLSEQSAAQEIDRRIADLMREAARPATLVVTGGATLAAVLHAVGGARLAVLGELAPGVPVARIESGRFDGVTLVSKSGAFGAKGFLRAVFGQWGTATVPAARSDPF